MNNQDDEITYETAILYAVMGEILRECKTEILSSSAYKVAMQNNVFSQVKPLLNDIRPLRDSLNDMSNGFTKLSHEMFTELKKQQEKTNESS